VRFNNRRTAAVAASFLAFALVAVGCGSDKSSSASSSSKSGKVALLLPESKTARYESRDRPLFTAKLKELCPNCELLYSNAEQDAAKQQAQADAALTNGAKVLVLDPVDAASAASIVAKAKSQNVPVISYDRLVSNADLAYYISFDNEQVGRLQAQSLVDRLNTLGTTSKGQIVMINGSPTDNNATLFKKGAHSVLDGKVTIGKEFDTPDWSPDNAQKEMDQAITALGKGNIVGVYAANDGTAGGAIASMKAAGVATPLPPVTGQDAELAAVQRVVAGEQYMTVYKAVKTEAEQAATLAAAIVMGTTVPTTTVKTNNGKYDVPSFILTPIAVTKANIKDTIVKDGFWTVADICTSAYVTSCTAISLS